MSYDLQVYTAGALSPESVRQLVSEAGFEVDEEGSAGGSLCLVRGARRRYSFTLEPPLRVESEDIPDEVTAAALGISCLYEVLVGGSPANEVPHAVRFARRLAAAAHGVVLDGQTDRIWSQSKLREAPRVDNGEVSVVDARWYVRSTSDPGAAAELWLTLARRYLPEAVPRRFGTFEPLQHRLEPGGDQSFVDAVRSVDGDVSFTSGKPTLGGHVAARDDSWPIGSHGLTLLREPLNDPRWRDALHRLFVEFAESVDAVLATAEVLRRWSWSRSGLSVTPGRSELGNYLAARGEWSGLLPYPTWWTWFGPDYVPYVRHRLPADRVEHRGSALFFQRSDIPADRDELHAADSAADAIPPELLAPVDRSDPGVLNPHLLPAAVRPSGLT